MERDTAVDRGDLFRQEAMMWSAEHGRELLLELLLGKSEDVQSTDQAALRKMLAETSKGPQSTNQSNRSLLWAAKHGHLYAAKLLPRTSTDIDAKDSLGYTAILWAAREGHIKIAQMLVDQGADIHARTVYGETPLWWAARNGHETLVLFLLDVGADIESRDKFGLTPLAWAVENRHEPVVRVLVDWGANIWTSDKSGQTPHSRSGGTKMRALLLKGERHYRLRGRRAACTED
ncbi:serine/threonine-protein phosphatase 6 regulatory ankyrin repeat subunit A [Aspergillus udagawae]|nr:serine/threonine-protein phosphatase 6 regulatory ankyrin repeat subunit A [Aspergillus udagawae]